MSGTLTHTLADLPNEIQENIYLKLFLGQVIVVGPTERCRDHSKPGRISPKLDILFVCRKIYDLARPVYLRHCVFDVNDGLTTKMLTPALTRAAPQIRHIVGQIDTERPPDDGCATYSAQELNSAPWENHNLKSIRIESEMSTWADIDMKGDDDMWFAKVSINKFFQHTRGIKQLATDLDTSIDKRLLITFEVDPSGVSYYPIGTIEIHRRQVRFLECDLADEERDALLRLFENQIKTCLMDTDVQIPP